MKSSIFSVMLWALTVSLSHADIIFEVRDASVSVNGTANIDVYVSSTANDAVDWFSVTAFIDPLSATANGFLGFSASQPDISTDPDYLFFGDSFGYLSSAGSTSGEYAAFDNTVTDNGLVVMSGTQKLIARFEVTHNGDANAVNDTFTVSLVGSGSNPNSDTTWVAAAGDGFSAGTGFSIDGTSDLSATVTVTAAVPEPSTFAAFCFAGVGLCVRRISRRREWATLQDPH